MNVYKVYNVYKAYKLGRILSISSIMYKRYFYDQIQAYFEKFYVTVIMDNGEALMCKRI